MQDCASGVCGMCNSCLAIMGRRPAANSNENPKKVPHNQTGKIQVQLSEKEAELKKLAQQLGRQAGSGRATQAKATQKKIEAAKADLAKFKKDNKLK